jgi:hypothetical protein
VTDRQCSTEYKKECRTTTVQECTSVKGVQKCWDEPREVCDQVPRLVDF